MSYPFLTHIKSSLKSIFRLVFPKCCVVCDNVLSLHEQHICIDCMMALPLAKEPIIPNDVAQERLKGKFDFVDAKSLFYYSKGSLYKNIIYRIKYKGDSSLAKYMSNIMCDLLSHSDFFTGIDLIVPIPLHKSKKAKRGFNQSELISKALSERTKIAYMPDNIVRMKNTKSQTDQDMLSRWSNVEGAFRVIDESLFVGKHILLIDDVLTTGATITSCVDSFKHIEGVNVSVLTMFVANYNNKQ